MPFQLPDIQPTTSMSCEKDDKERTYNLFVALGLLWLINETIRLKNRIENNETIYNARADRQAR